MYGKIRSVIRSDTFQQSAVTTVATFLSAGLGAVFYLVLARVMGVKEYGLFSLGLSILLAGSSLADLGMGPSIVRFVSAHRHSKEYAPYANVALRTKLLTSTLAILILTLFANFLANNILHQPDAARVLPWVGLSIACFVLFSFVASIFQGLQQFWWWGGIQVGANAFRLLLLGCLVILGAINAQTGLILFGGSLLLAFGISWLKLNKSIITAKPDIEHATKFWEFNKWTAIFTITASLVSRLDTILTARYLSISDVGVYSLAITMTSFLPQLSGALGAVTGPKFASFTSQHQTRQYLIKSTQFSAGISIFCCLLMVPAAMFVIWFTGKDYGPAMVPFLILLGSVGLFTATNPIRDSILYGYKKPKFFFISSLLQGVITVTVGTQIIPMYGITGAALSMVVSQIVLLASSILYYRKISK